MKTRPSLWLRNSLCGLGLAMAALSSTGCQGWYAGQTLPSPWYIHDDIQYFPPGPEFKLAREAAAMKAYKADLEATGGAVAVVPAAPVVPVVPGPVVPAVPVAPAPGAAFPAVPAVPVAP